MRADVGTFIADRGFWALLVIALAVVAGVVIALRERKRREALIGTLGENVWTAPCLDAERPGVKRLLIVAPDALSIAETKSGSRDSWPWAEVAAVGQGETRIRMSKYPTLRIELAGGHTRELLVYIGEGRNSYEVGAVEARARIAAELRRTGGSQ